MERFDAIIIGFGKGGKTLAGKLAGSGKKVAMVEKSAGMFGGTCINVGCIPSKSLVRSSGLAGFAASGGWDEKAAWYRDAIQEKRRLTGMLREKNYQKLAGSPNVTVYVGTASFLSNTQVQIRTENDTVTVDADQIFINTGSKPVVPPVEGLEGNRYVYYSESMMDLTELPKRLVIIGGGYIGLEFASMYTGFGSEVTVIQDGETFLPREDADIAARIKEAFEKRGVEFCLGAKVQRIGQADGFADVHIQHQGEEKVLEAEAVLVATGRKPNTEELNVEAAGVQLTSRGAVLVDETLKTTAPNIWAMGDVAGGLQFTYVSLDDFRIVWSQLNGGSDSTARRKNVPYSVFIDPPFSRVGLNEKEAAQAGYQFKVHTLEAAAIPKAQVLKKPQGILKALVDENTGKILGAMLFCEESYEMINLIKLAMDLNADASVLRSQIFTHPTMSEALNDLFA